MPQKPPRKQPAPTTPREPRAGFVAVAYVRRPHGVRGEIAVEPLTDFAERFRAGATLYANGRPREILAVRPHKGSLLLQLQGIESSPQAGELRGTLLEVAESELAPLAGDRYYRFQLIGMEAVDTGGNALGRLEEILETGANDVYIVRDAEGELLVPAIDSVVRNVDVEARRITVELLPGLERRPLARKPARKAQSPGRAGRSRPS